MITLQLYNCILSKNILYMTIKESIQNMNEINIDNYVLFVISRNDVIHITQLVCVLVLYFI